LFASGIIARIDWRSPVTVWDTVGLLGIRHDLTRPSVSSVAIHGVWVIVGRKWCWLRLTAVEVLTRLSSPTISVGLTFYGNEFTIFVTRWTAFARTLIRRAVRAITCARLWFW
jgi:hypothetical protein